MSDELLDGRELRKRKPRLDHEADAVEHEDRAPLPRAQNPADQPSGPYVVLEPPPEAAASHADDETAQEWLDSEMGSTPASPAAPSPSPEPPQEAPNPE